MTGFDRLASVLRGRRFCAAKPSVLAWAAVSVLAVWDTAADRRLVLVDVDHPLLAGFADTVPAGDVLARLAALPPAEPTGPVWTVRTASGTVVAPQRAWYDAALAPPRWNEPAALGPVTLRTDDADGPCVVEHHRSGAPVAPGEAATELLLLLALFTRTAPAAIAVLTTVLAKQPLFTATVRPDGTFHRRVGDRAPHTHVPCDGSAAFVWDRSAVGGAVHVIEPASPLLDGARSTDKNGNPVVPIGAPLALAAGLAAPPDGPDGVLIDRGPGWTPVPGMPVQSDAAGWTVPLDPAASPPGAARRVALRADGRTLVHDPCPGVDTRTALDRIAAFTAGLAGHAVATRDAWGGSHAAVEATRRRAVDWLGARRTPIDRDAVDHVVATVLRTQSDPPPLPAVQSALPRVGVEDLEERHYGTQAVALLVLERELERRFKRKDTDPGVFADALTAYLVALNQASTETWPWAWQRIVRHLREYLGRARQPQRREPTLSEQALPPAVRPEWERLARRIPWIRWLARPALDPPHGVAVSAADVVDLLTLLRPRQEPVMTGTRRHSSDMAVRNVPLPPRFAQLYRGPAVAPAVLGDLADALGPLLHDPGQSARMAQALTLPPALDAAVGRRLADAIEDQTAAAHLLVVRVDDTESPRVLLANLSPHAGLYVRLDDEPVRLAPCAVEQEGAFNYCAVRATTTGGQLTVGSQRVPLDAVRSPLDEGADVTLPALPADLFRGREQQLARLRRVIGGSGPRAGSLVFGTRRAGKSSLAYQVSRDDRLRGRLWIDLGDTPTSVTDAAAWNRSVCRTIARQARRELGIALDPSEGDVVELLADLDDALDGGRPVAVVLDELDVLLLPEQGGAGRRTAGRLGNLAGRNLVLIGTVQRFHRSVHEFKTWQAVECPADLSWADGVTYFFGPLADRSAGPRVEWPRRAGVAPRHFATEIVPRIGLRPYFWARLRNGLDAHVHDDRAGTRLVTAQDVRRYLDRLVVEDPHLNTVIDDGAGLDAQERRRHDLFGVDERRILVQFAQMATTGKTLSVTRAVRAGGEEALAELVDRAYLAYTPEGTLRTAVPIYHDFLRARVTDLVAVTPAG
ncbi:hypothetical protein BTM25_25000 [Actinomadura rubteroloni]|uniref:Uncharacterized protein n=1 Tax=Actinomadura rubteroloni TaxID=1926885 RepID=A0A2P4UFN2_9ACTN|nr:hypothetical protein [Actinomadura rubteroloni]POM23874.1 hypothetical protein BTM25_25000 [Actinomadura rubteroloni]